MKKILIAFILILNCKMLFSQKSLNTYDIISKNTELIKICKDVYSKKVLKDLLISDSVLILNYDSTQNLVFYLQDFKNGIPDTIYSKISQSSSKYNTNNVDTSLYDKRGFFLFLSNMYNEYQLGELYFVSKKSIGYRGYKCTPIYKSYRIRFIVYKGEIKEIISVSQPNKCVML